jgi:putative ABC transport system permease protein
LISRPFQTFSSISVIALSAALAVILMLLAHGLVGGLTRAVEPFDIVVSAKGSPYQLVLNAVFLQDAPAGNIEWESYAELRDDARVDLAVPLGFGDSYRGFEIVGTTGEILRIRGGLSDSPWLRVKEGRWFERQYEAVLGARAASESGLAIGGRFRTSHGITGYGDEHEEFYEVVGILHDVMGPYDRAVFVNIEDIWAAHERHGENEGGEREVTAVLIRPVSYAGAYSLAASYQRDERRQLVFPAQTAVRLFSMIGRGEEFLSIVVYAVSGFALLVTLLALYWSSAGRKRERALLRVLGASRRDILMIAWLEGTFSILAGAVIGEILGRAGTYAVFKLLHSVTAIYPLAPMTVKELAIPAALSAIGSLCGFAVTAGDRSADIARGA